MENKKFSDYENNKSNLMTGTDDCFNEGIKGNCGSKCKVFLEGLCENSCEINKKNKKFSELKVGDDLHIFYYRCIDTRKITNIEKIKDTAIKITTDFNSYMITESLQEEFCIISQDKYAFYEAIATSMDRLLLETE